MQQHEHTRRHLLVSLVGAMGISAGCNARPNEPDTESPQTDAGELPNVDSVEVADSDLVVSLVTDHDVSTLTLVGPDGQAVVEQSVATGERTVPLSILDIDPELSGYEHYTPGAHELVVETADETNRTTVPLEPDLQVTAVEQYTDGESAAELGNLAITVENTGTGPTWIHDITYSDAPNVAANGELSNDPGVPLFTIPDSTHQLVVSPGESQRFVDPDSPLLFSNDGEVDCGQQSAQFKAYVAHPTGEPLTRSINVRGTDQSESVSVSGGRVCENTTVEHSPQTADD